MIWVFSATGNSRHAADRLGQLLSEPVRDLSQCKGTLSLQDQREIFVLPLYFWGLPSLVQEWLGRTAAQPRSTAHVVMTCGGALGGGDRLIRRNFRKAGFSHVYVHELVMQTNYIVLHRTGSQSEADRRLAAAEAEIGRIADDIRENRSRYRSALPKGILAAVFHGYYQLRRTTRPFRVSDACIGCGQCAKGCPAGAIAMVQGRPRWTKPRCALCLRCLHRCPALAIDYGRATRGKTRYVYPSVRER